MKETEKNVFEPMPETTDDQQIVAQPPAAASEEEELAEARKNLLAGLVWCLGGLAFSYGSYYLTQAGGRYFVATGAVIWGVVQAGRGLFAWMKIKRRNGRFGALWGMAVGTVCGLAGVIYLLLLSSQLGEGSGLEPLNRPQVYTVAQAGLRITVPEGFTAFEIEDFPETDSTYAHHQMYTQDGLWEMNVATFEGVLEGAERIGDAADFIRERDSLYYSGGVVTPTRPCTYGGREMLCSEGRQKDYPAYLFARHNMQIGEALVTVTLIYPSGLHGTDEARKRTEELLERIEQIAPGGKS